MKKKQVVYFAQVGGTKGLILIARSDDPNERLKSLIANKGEPAELLGVIDGDLQPIHQILNAYRVEGKPRWFHPHENVLKWVAKYCRLSSRTPD